MRGRVVVVRDEGESSTLRGHGDRVTSVAFSPLGTLLATTSRDQIARIWSLATNEVVQSLQHNSEVNDGAFSPNGRWLVTGTHPRERLGRRRRRRSFVVFRGTTGR